MNKLLLKIFIWLNNFSYKAISSLVVRLHNGIHPKHKILKYHNFFATNTSTFDKVLDIGCGNGSVSYDVSKKAKIVVGIDIDKNNVLAAQKKYANTNLRYIIGDAMIFDFNEQFDIIILSNVLEHIDDRIIFLEKIKKIAPKILIRVPLITRDWLSIYKKEIEMEYRLDPTHFIEYTEKNFKEEINKAGLKIESYYIKFGELYAIVRSSK